MYPETPKRLDGYTIGNVLDSCNVNELTCNELGAELLEQDELIGVETLRCVDLKAVNIHQVEIDIETANPDTEVPDDPTRTEDKLRIIPLAPRRNLVVRIGAMDDLDSHAESLFISTHPRLPGGVSTTGSVAIGEIPKCVVEDSTLIGSLGLEVSGKEIVSIGETSITPSVDNEASAEGVFPLRRVIAIGKNTLVTPGTNVIRIGDDHMTKEPTKRLSDHLVVGGANCCPPDASLRLGDASSCLTIGSRNSAAGFGGALNLTVGCDNEQTAYAGPGCIVAGNSNEQIDPSGSSIIVGSRNRSKGGSLIVGHRNKANKAVCLGSENFAGALSVVLGREIGRQETPRTPTELEETLVNPQDSRRMNLLVGRDIKATEGRMKLHESIIVGSEVHLTDPTDPDGLLSRNLVIGDKVEKALRRDNVSIGHNRLKAGDAVDRRGASSSVCIGHGQTIMSHKGVNVNTNREITIGHGSSVNTTTNSLVIGNNSTYRAEDNFTFTAIGNANRVEITGKKHSERPDDILVLGNGLEYTGKDDGCKVFIRCPGIVVSREVVQALRRPHIQRREASGTSVLTATKTLLSTTSYAPLQLDNEIAYIPIF